MDKSKNSKYNLSKSCSLPLFSKNGNAGRLPSCLTVNDFNQKNNLVNPNIIKMKMIGDRIKKFRKTKAGSKLSIKYLNGISIKPE